MTRTRLAALVALTGITLMLPISTAGAGEIKPACDLLKAKEVSAAFGQEATKEPASRATSCRFAIADGSLVFLGVSEVTKTAKKDFEANSKSPTAEKVKGLDEAFFDVEIVTFIEGDAFVNVQFSERFSGVDPTTTSVKKPLTKLAKNVAKRL